MSHTFTKEHKYVKLDPKVVSYTVHFIPEEVGGYSVIVPALPGCYSQGETLDEAEKYVVEAIELYLESLSEYKEMFPQETAEAIERYFTDFAKEVPPLPGSAPMVWKRINVTINSA